MKEQHEITPTRFFLYRKAEYLFVEGGLPLETIPAFLGSKIGAQILIDWHNKGEWDKKREKYLELNKSLIDDARHLAKMALVIAKCEPTSANISTFKRSIEAVIALEKITPSEAEDENNYELTPEKIDEFAKKAGLR